MMVRDSPIILHSVRNDTFSGEATLTRSVSEAGRCHSLLTLLVSVQLGRAEYKQARRASKVSPSLALRARVDTVVSRTVIYDGKGKEPPSLLRQLNIVRLTSRFDR